MMSLPSPDPGSGSDSHSGSRKYRDAVKRRPHRVDQDLVSWDGRRDHPVIFGEGYTHRWTIGASHKKRGVLFQYVHVLGVISSLPQFECVVERQQ